MNISTLKGALPIAARLLAEQCGLTVRIGGNEARACEGEITLPDLPIEVEKARVLGLGWILHEGAGHIVNTDFESVKAMDLAKFAYRMYNALEDIRVERLVERKYPGANRMFVGMREILSEDGLLREMSNAPDLAEAIVTATAHTLHWRVLKRPVFQGREAIAVQWLEVAFGRSFTDAFLTVIGKVQFARTSVDAANLALEAVALLQQFADENAEPQQDTDDPQSDGDDKADGDQSSSLEEPDDGDASAEPDAGDSDGAPAGADGAEPFDASSKDQPPNAGDSTTNADDAVGDDAGKDGLEDGSTSSAQAESTNGGSSNAAASQAEPPADSDNATSADGSGDSEPGGDDDSLQIGPPAGGNGFEADAWPDAGAQAEADAQGVGAAVGGFDPQAKATAAAVQAALAAGYNPGEDLGELIQGVLNRMSTEAGVPPVLSAAIPFTEEIDDNSEIVQRVKRESIALRRRLTTALEATTQTETWDAYAGERLSNLGVLRLSTGDLNIFEQESSQTSIDVAIQILLDRSGSMRLEERIALAVDACTALGIALGQIDGVQVATAAFPAGSDGCDRNVLVLNSFGESVRKRAGRIAAMRADGENTPLADAMLFGQYTLLSTKATRRILLPITDGMPDSIEGVGAVVRSCQRWGVEVMGIGIGLDISKAIPDSITIDKVADLPTRMFEMLRKQLVLKRAA
jgi:Mg-chelatase subunit ChlD